MMEFVAELRKLCESHRADVTDVLTSGGVLDYASYSKAVGAIQALDRILLEIDSLEKKYIEE